MIILLLYFRVWGLTINPSNVCSCSQLPDEDQCSQTDNSCLWKNETCIQASCKQMNSSDDCFNLPNSYQCAWNNKTKLCETFTYCSNYTYSDGQQCQQIGDCDEGNQNADGSIQCVRAQLTQQAQQKIVCQEISEQSVCEGEDELLQQIDGQYCYWQNDTETNKSICTSTFMTQCQDANQSSYLCDQFSQSCYFDTNATECADIKCETLSEDECSQFTSIDYNTITLCTWNNINDKCEDLQIQNLTNETCFIDTYNTYVWKDSCTICQSFAKIYAFILYIII